MGLDNVTEFDTIPNFSSGGTWIYFEVATRDQIGNYDSTGVAEDSIYHPLPTGVEDEGDIQLPVAFSLDQNYPNPFNPVTTISFSLPTASSVTLGVFNTLGQKVATVADGFYDAGIHAVEWDGSNASSGVYFYRIETNAFIETKKMVLMK